MEDRRGSTAKRTAVGGGLGAIVLALIVMFMGGDPSKLLASGVGAGQSGGGSATGVVEESAEERALKQFVGVVLGDTEDVWNKLLQGYQEPGLVLFRDQVESACGFQSAAVGPFYCPGDGKVYLDLSFFQELGRKLGAPGDFAQAYVIAHEVGHHVQNLLGTSDTVHRQRGNVSEVEANELSVRLELQADFYAGVWAHHAQKMFGSLERGDIEEALNAASQIGDDTLQRRARGKVMPESFTHGSAEQRMRWFRLGLETGDIQRGNTFAVADRDL